MFKYTIVDLVWLLALIIVVIVAGCTASTITPTGIMNPNVETSTPTPDGTGGGINYEIINLPLGVTRLIDDYGVCYILGNVLQCFPKEIDITVLEPIVPAGTGGGNVR